jgi:hypothetical protein
MTPCLRCSRFARAARARLRARLHRPPIEVKLWLGASGIEMPPTLSFIFDRFASFEWERFVATFRVYEAQLQMVATASDQVIILNEPASDFALRIDPGYWDLPDDQRSVERAMLAQILKGSARRS